MKDRRIRKTEDAIHRALTELMGEKCLRKITVKELCERADINKSTFYLHYGDIYDCLLWFRNRLGERLGASFDGLSLSQIVEDLPRILSRMIAIINENRKAFLPIFKSSEMAGFLKSIREGEIERLVGRADPQQRDNPAFKPAAVFIINGLFGLVEQFELEEIEGERAAVLTQKIQKGFGDCL